MMAISFKRFEEREILESKLAQSQKDTLRAQAEDLAEKWQNKKLEKGGITAAKSPEDWIEVNDRAEQLARRIYYIICAAKVKTVNPAAVRFARAQERRESEEAQKAVDNMRYGLARAAGLTRGLKTR